MLLIPNALCWSSRKCNCACALAAEVQLRLRVTPKVGKNCLRVKILVHTVNNRGRLEIATSAIGSFCWWKLQWEELKIPVMQISYVVIKSLNYPIVFIYFLDDNCLRDSSQTLVRGPDGKRGPLKFLVLLRGALKKNTTNFPVKKWVYMLFMGLIRNFHGKKGGPEIFEVWKGTPKRLSDIFLHQPPLQVFVNGPFWRWISYVK